MSGHKNSKRRGYTKRKKILVDIFNELNKIVRYIRTPPQNCQIEIMWNSKSKSKPNLQNEMKCLWKLSFPETPTPPSSEEMALAKRGDFRVFMDRCPIITRQGRERFMGMAENIAFFFKDYFNFSFLLMMLFLKMLLQPTPPHLTSIHP